MISLEDQKKIVRNILKRAENTQTFDFTDPKKLLKSNTPEDWFGLINYVRSKVRFPNSYQKHNVLSDLYEKAIKEFEPRTHKNNEACAHLFVQYAQLKSTHFLENAADLFKHARAIFRKFAIVHIASAQFELKRDDVEESRRILQKAVVLEAQPIANIQVALDSLQERATSVYTSPQPWLEPFVLAGHNHSSGSESTDQMRVQTSNRPSGSMSFSRANTFLPGRVKKINLPCQIMLEENEEDSHNTTQDSFKPFDTNNHTTYGHTSGYLSMSSMTCDSTIARKIEPIENKVKKKPEMPKPVQEPPRKPLAPKQLEPETPNNKQPVVPCTPMQLLFEVPSKVLTVNDQHYEIMGVLGKGESSQVYQCLNTSHKIVAIKCVNLKCTDLGIATDYRNEIRMLKHLHYCDKVITIYDSELRFHENRLYIVMESGSEDLASFLTSQMGNKKQLSHNLIRYYWEIMLEAVLALHKEGIIHLDLKPENFLLVGGKLKLIDFGIAKILGQDEFSIFERSYIGMLDYMSPERIYLKRHHGEGKKFMIGVKSDVWSLGCILYNMVYKRMPYGCITQDFFKENTSKEDAILDPGSPIEFPELPNKYLVDVMKKCLTRDPNGRPSVAELLSHSYLRGGDI